MRIKWEGFWKTHENMAFEGKLLCFQVWEEAEILIWNADEMVVFLPPKFFFKKTNFSILEKIANVM